MHTGNKHDATAAISEIAKAFTSSLQLDHLLRKIMEKIDEVLHPDTWSMLLVDEAKQELYFELAIGKNAHTLKDVRIKMGQGLAGWVAQNQQAVIVPDVSKDTRFLTDVDESSGRDTRSVIAVPIKFQDRCLGVIELINYIGYEGFSQEQLMLLETISDFAAIAIENARQVQAIHELTITDERTGLYNSRHLNFILDTELDRSQRYGYEFTLIFIDIGKMNDVLEFYGRSERNAVLTEVAQLLRTQCRLIDFVFYYDDGEFVLLLPQTSKETGCVVARRIHRLIRSTRWLAERAEGLCLAASLGVATYPTDGATKRELLLHADEALLLF